MNYKIILKKITLPLGFTLGSTPKLKRFSICKRINKPVYIEFVGASGVGKSTMYKKISKGYCNNWLDILHFEELYSDKIADLINELPSYYNELAKSRFDYVSNGTDSYIEKLNALRTGYNILMRDGLLHLLNKESVVVSDEGLLQFYSKGVINLERYNKKDFLKLIKNRKIVYCYAPADVIVERIIERQSKLGHLWFKHKGKSRETLLEVVNDNNKRINLMISIVENYIPVLRINTNEQDSVNINLIQSFIKDDK